ncbi:hypothetical protein ID866_4320 [Astraeus odoratus]|nr:hypothetical protein ID866_4320 [Astraeus odoratus]
MVVQTVQLPDLLSLFPKKPGGVISLGFKGAYDGYNEWVRSTLGYFFSVEVYNAEMPLLAALAYPIASEQELRAILDYMTSSFMLEEMTVSINCEQRRGMVARMKSAIDPFHWPQFISSNVEFAKNTIREALDREASKDVHATRDIQSYMMTRRETIGTRPMFVLMRSTRRLYIPDEVLEHEVVADMENAALDAVYIANDIYSFKKEQGDNGALNNIITVIQKDPDTCHLDLQGSIDYAGDLFKEVLDRFHSCRQRLPSVDNDMDRYLSAYADGLIDWMIGNIEWSMVNRRYKAFCNDSDRRINVVRLDSRHFPLLQLLLCFVLLTAFVAAHRYGFTEKFQTHLRHYTLQSLSPADYLPF